MAARAPAAIGDLTDELLARVFAALEDPNVDEEEPMRDRCTLPCVCRRWRALAASPAAAPVWARVEVALVDDPAADPVRFSSLVGWFAIHGAHVRSLALDSESNDAPRAWETVRAVAAMTPSVEELSIDCISTLPAGLEWWRPLARGLTYLCLSGEGIGSLVDAGARAALPPALLELHLGVVDRLPPALAGLARLTRLEVSDIGVSAQEAASGGFLQELGALRSLAFNCETLMRVPAAMGALTALTHLVIGSYAMSAPGALDPLALLSRLEYLRFRVDGLRTPSALAGMTSLRELALVRSEAFENSNEPIIGPGPYLAGLRVLTLYFFQQNAPPGLVDVPRRVVEPLRAATALTYLALLATVRCEAPPASCLLLTADRVEALVAGKPALRRVHIAQEMCLLDDGANFAALRLRHPQIEFSLPGSSEYGRWYR